MWYVRAFKRGCFLIVIPLIGCTGPFSVKAVSPVQTLNDGATVGAVAKNPFSCNSNDAGSTSDLRRLTRREYLLTLKDILAPYVAIANLQSEIDGLPADSATQIFDTMDASTNSAHASAYQKIATAAGRQLAMNGSWRRAVLGCEGDSGMNDACWERYFSEFAMRIVRRPLSAEEKADLKNVFAEQRGSSDSMGLAAATTYLLQLPEFIYKLEGSGNAVPGKSNVYELTGYELASRLAFFATGRGPTLDLLKRASELETTEGLKTAVNQLFESAAAREHVESFFLQWMGAGQMAVPAHSDFFLRGAERGRVRDEALEELKSFTKTITFDVKGGYDALLTSEANFGLGQTLSALYEIPVASPAMVSGQRPGILSRLGFLLGATDQTSLVHRGLIVRRNILCEKIPAPSFGADEQDLIKPPEPSATDSLRTQIENRTSSNRCMGCHSKINPMGFVLENYDSLGRYRSQESIFDSQGRLIASHPINARVRPNIDRLDEPEVEGLSQMAAAISNSTKGPACATIQWFTYNHGRDPDGSDSCTLRFLFEALRNQSAASPVGEKAATLLNMMKSTAFNPSFRTRTLGAQN